MTSERGKKHREKKYLWGDLGEGLILEREGGSVGGCPAREGIVNGEAAEGGSQVQSTYKRPLTISPPGVQLVGMCANSAPWQ